MRYLIAALALMLVAGAARGEEFVVQPGGRNLVVFESKAPTETFRGKTKNMTGTITVNPGLLGDSATVHIEVDLASLDTGMKLRDKHMRENHLETSKYPKAVFDGATLIEMPKGAHLDAEHPRTLEMEGTFTIHGVSRRIRVAVKTTLLATEGRRELSFRTEFPVKLSDYAIPRPQFLFLKLAETQQVRVEGVAISSHPEPVTATR